MDYKVLIENLVADAMGKLPGLTKTVTVKYFVSEGQYDAETDTTTPVYDDVPDVVCVAAKPTFDDVQNHAVTFAHTKFVIPGKFLPKSPENDTDKIVIQPAGEVWNIKKVVGVPGDGVYLVFCVRT